MISSSMEEIMRQFSEKAKDRGTEVHEVGDKGTHVARGSDKTDEVQTVQPNVDRKGKCKIDPSEDIGTPYNLQPLSFNLRIGYTQPDDVHSEDIQKQVDFIISDVLTATKSVQKPIQPDLLRESHRKKRTKKSASNASASGKSVILLTDSNMGQPIVSNDDDDFVNPPPRRQDTPSCEKSPIDEAPSTAHNYPDELHPHMQQWVDFLSKTVSTMISSSMEEIMRQFSEKAKDRGTEVHEVGDKGTHVARGSDKTDEVQTVQPNVDRKGKCKIDPSEDIGTPYNLQPLSFDLRIGYTQPDDVHSEDIQKQVDFIISDVLTATKSVQVENIGHMFSLPLSTPWADVDHVFMSMLPTNKAHWMLGVLQFRSHTLTVFNSAGKTYRDWKVLEGIEPYVKILPALMNALRISRKDPDYEGPDSKELKVYIDSTLPQQTNG
ncbi:sentrin-specific protease 1-like [Olea europaea subsp. europaea]|uniref:Sentrin-specific protease 1-like n=1 Tax=Olea europaea subsp. europaea TaxID=158383 RepID=A0A8S0PH68_OLEEU|nr:sentrin-specific protease 1-like [Olea europaea subsp. europaea]